MNFSGCDTRSKQRARNSAEQALSNVAESMEVPTPAARRLGESARQCLENGGRRRTLPPAPRRQKTLPAHSRAYPPRPPTFLADGRPTPCRQILDSVSLVLAGRRSVWTGRGSEAESGVAGRRSGISSIAGARLRLAPTNARGSRSSKDTRASASTAGTSRVDKGRTPELADLLAISP